MFLTYNQTILVSSLALGLGLFIVTKLWNNESDECDEYHSENMDYQPVSKKNQEKLNQEELNQEELKQEIKYPQYLETITKNELESQAKLASKLETEPELEPVIKEIVSKEQQLEKQVGDNLQCFEGDFVGPYQDFTVVNESQKGVYFETLEDAMMNSREKDIAIINNKRGYSLRTGVFTTEEGVDKRSIKKYNGFQCWIREDIINHPKYGDLIKIKLGISTQV